MADGTFPVLQKSSWFGSLSAVPGILPREQKPSHARRSTGSVRQATDSPGHRHPTPDPDEGVVVPCLDESIPCKAERPAATSCGTTAIPSR